MKYKSLIALVFICLTALGTLDFFLFFHRPAEDTKAPYADQVHQKNEAFDKKRPQATISAIQPGVYSVYSNQSFHEAQGTRLLFFHAPWCPQCQKLDEDIKKTKLPDNLTIFKVDYDTATELRQQYGVTLQTTIVQVSQNAELVHKIVAYDDPSYATLQQAFKL